MIDYSGLYHKLEDMGLQQWSLELQQSIPKKIAKDAHGKMPQWLAQLSQLPVLKPSHIDLKNTIEIGSEHQLESTCRESFITQLKQFHPWRKGPYSLFGITLDTEWRSDWKWWRLLPYISPLSGRKVLDIGGGNGYHGWRMLGEGAEFVLGIDPTLVFVMQFQLIKHFIGASDHYVLPIGIEALPDTLACFDTVFSMGVLYHRRSPLDHLIRLRTCLKSGGELVLETLIIEGDEGMTLMPKNRYAKMRNVWFLPTVLTMTLWLKRTGFINISCVDISTTTIAEQRRTDWMTFESLADFLDPQDNSKTIEGYPAPKRAIFIATAP